MLLFAMGNKTIINITTGEKLGFLKYCDLKINENEGKIEALMLPKGRLNAFFSHQDEYIEIPWSAIRKIGTDTILVEL
ncbi:MAG: YlmC/YmxH family sporulation protein [Eubacteriaceae bacterium]|nr:YlmC/YmxH family sporulation protein [Eubacteriaceae bacterium]